MQYKSLLPCFIAVAALLIPMQLFAQEVEEPQPLNIIIVMADDLDQHSMDILLNASMMPNLQSAIIDQGVTFNNSFSTYPLCCPARATLLTGQYTHNHGVWANVPPLGGVAKFNDTETLATWLSDDGYYTAFVGKYLNRYGVDTPTNYVPPGWTDWQGTVGSSAYWYFGYTVNDNGKLVKYGIKPEHYQTDVLATRAVEVINSTEANDDQPFFLYVNTLAPHEDIKVPQCKVNSGYVTAAKAAPRHVGASAGISFLNTSLPSFNETDVSDKPKWLQLSPLRDAHVKCLDTLFHTRLEAMMSVDDLIGKLVTTLDEFGERENTVLIFTSDNGYMMGEHRMKGKVKPYEESIRLPLYVNVPGTNATTIDKLVINNDLAPTILELAGVEAGPEIDGRSLLPLMQNSSVTWRNGFLIEQAGFSAVRTDDYIYIYNKGGGRQFYDLANDPYQLQNIAYFKMPAMFRDALELWRLELAACSGMECQVAEDKPKV